MRYPWVMLDADGTVFDYDKSEATALERTFGDVGLAFEPEYLPAYRKINGQMWRAFEQGQISQDRLRLIRFEILFDALGIRADTSVFGQQYLIRLAEGTDLIAGAEALVQALHGQVKMLLITNGLAEVQRPRLARSAIGHYFSEVVISGEVGSAKPHTAIFDAAFEKMGWPSKNDVLIVGDSLTSDIQGGHNYQIDTCWFNPERRLQKLDLEIRYQIQRLDELPSIVGIDGTRPT